MNTTTVLAACAALVTLTGGIWGGTQILDQRLVTRVEFEAQAATIDELAYTIMKAEIRELREALREARARGDDEWASGLEADLEDALDRLCLRYPQDRECR